jgi:hypothetical protein
LATFIEDVLHEFRRHKGLADRAMAGLNDQQFFERPGPMVNPVALIVKHRAGNWLTVAPGASRGIPGRYRLLS